MTHDPSAPYMNEADKVAAIAVPYLQGRTVELGVGMRKIWPSVIGVDNAGTFGANTAADVRCDIRDLSMFADASFDNVVSSHALEDFAPEDVPNVLREWTRILRPGGHLVLYVPSANLYPKVGEPGANPAHKSNFWPGDIEKLLRDMPGVGWELLESEERDEANEYSLYIVAKRRESGWIENVWQRHPGGRKRCLIIRYGGIGDMIQMSSILPQLKAMDYHITVNARTETQSVIAHDPNIDAIIAQATDFVPNQQLGPYWAELGTRYDRVINLCESIEGALLQLNERLPAQYPDAVRRKLYGTVNYLERTHLLADVPFAPAPRFFETPEERRWAYEQKREPAVLWAINGSAPHKVWPWVHIVCAWLLQRTPAHIYLTADGGIGKTLQDAIVEKLREEGELLANVHPMAGKWSTRQALAFAKVADCVVGPETGVLNAVSHERAPKVVMMSHSSETNLTRDWLATTVLKPEADRAPCFPCHRLHHTFVTCHQDPVTHAALCAAGIAPARVFRAIAMALGATEMAAA